MKTAGLAKYSAPQMEIIEIEVESAVLNTSNGSGNSAPEFVQGTGRGYQVDF